MTAKQKKKPTVSFIDGIALRTLKPGKLYSARVRMDPDVQFGGEHETWYWSKSRKIEAPSKAKALEKAERYRKELVDGAGGTDLTVAEFAREWQAGREEQSRASLESTGIAKPSPRTIERDEMEIRRIEERFAKVKVRDLTPGGIERVIAEMRAEGISENTIFKMVKKLRHVLSRPVQRGYQSTEYIWRGRLTGVPDKFRIIEDYNCAEFFQDENDLTQFHVRFSGDNIEPMEFTCAREQRGKIEQLFIAHPDVTCMSDVIRCIETR